MAIRNRSCISPREAYKLLVFPATFSLILACNIFQIIFIISLIHLYLHFQQRESNCAALQTALQPLTKSSCTHFDFKSHTARPVAHTHTDILNTHTHTQIEYTHTQSLILGHLRSCSSCSSNCFSAVFLARLFLCFRLFILITHRVEGYIGCMLCEFVAAFVYVIFKL